MVLDIRMPGIGGLDVLSRLAEQSDLPVIMLTGRQRRPVPPRLQGRRHRVPAKPVDDDVFLDAVQAAVLHVASRERLSLTQAASDRLARLSGRERDVAARIVRA